MFSLLENAAATCDIDELKKEIEKMKKMERDFHISKYVRKEMVTYLMKKEADLLCRETRDQKMSEMLDFLVSEGLDFSAESPDEFYGETCLMGTALWNAQLCRTLIRLGTNVNAVDSAGRTALFYAVLSNDARTIVELLLDSGIDPTVNLRDVLLMTRDEIVLDLLIDRCIDHESEAETGKIISSVIATFNGGSTFWIAEKMLSKIPYSDVQQKIKVYEYLGCVFMGYPFLDIPFGALVYWRKAIELGNQHGVAGKGLPFYEDPNGLYGLTETSHFIDGYIQIIAAHHRENGNENKMFVINGLNMIGERVIESADDLKSTVRIIKSLLDNNCHDVLSDDPMPFGGFFMPNVSVRGYMETMISIFKQLLCLARKLPGERGKVTELVAKFVKLKLVDSRNQTALHLAVRSNGNRIIKMLLECGADVHARDSNGRNPFHLYLRKHVLSLSPKMLGCFIEHGSHIDEKMDEGTRIHEYLQRRGHFELQEGKYVTLQCLAARAIVDQGISYEGRIPKLLSTLIDLH